MKVPPLHEREAEVELIPFLRAFSVQFCPSYPLNLPYLVERATVQVVNVPSYYILCNRLHPGTMTLPSYIDLQTHH